MCTRWFWDPELSRMHLHLQIQIPNAFLGTSPRDIFSYNDFGYRCIFWHHFPQSDKKNLLKSSLRGSISGSIIGKRGFPIFFKPCTPISLFLRFKWETLIIVKLGEKIRVSSMWDFLQVLIKFICSENATKHDEIYILFLTLLSNL